MSLKAYMSGNKSLSRAVVLNIVGVAIFVQIVEILVSKGVLPQFETPGTIRELTIFLAIYLVILTFDYVVWKCADNARYPITRFLGKAFATKGVLFLILVIAIWVYKL